MRPASRDGFEIAIICALALEADAVKALFDETYDRFGQVYGRQIGDKNAYITGKIGRHNVVLCHLPGMGKRSAAAAAAYLRVSYTHIQLALVVGICGGVPFPSSNTEIILGDVIISDSVVEYDFGKQYSNRFQRKSDVSEALGRPSQEIRALLAGLNSFETRKELQDRTYQYLHSLQARRKEKWQHPGIMHDVLFKASYRHKHHRQDSVAECICFDCNSSNDSVCDEALKQDCNSLGCEGSPVYRSRHVAEATNPFIHIGRVASADAVMKSGEDRDQIAEREGVIGFEMEGAGVWDNVPCIIIKGVCDYADSHKNKMWQDYAAATAASGTKAFLEYWIPTSLEIDIVESQRPHMATYLQSYYTSAKRLQIQRISGELLPMDQCYINLAIMEQLRADKEKSTHQPFSLFARLKVETIDKDKQVSLPELFEPRKQLHGASTIPKRILIQGRAGVGKTTLCKKIVYNYLHLGMWHQLFDLLLWMPLRRLKGKFSEKYTLVDVFHNLYFSELEEGKDLARKLWETVNDPTKKSKILFVLDGLDEVSQEWDSETPMNNVLMRLLDHPQVIITSRPYGINLGRLESFDLELETIGFDADQVDAYVKKVEQHDSKKANGILAFIQEHTLISGLVRIPIQLDALCYSWDRSFMSEDGPKTMTTLYQAITLKLWQKDILRLGKSEEVRYLNEHTVQNLSASQIQDIIPGEINLLERLSFIGLYNEVVEFNENDRHRVYDSLKRQSTLLPVAPDTALKKISFLHTSDTTNVDQDRSYHFLHLTFQEFFAAQYFVRCWMKDEQLLCIKLRQRIFSPLSMTPQAFLQKEKYNSRYNILWRFVAGLLQGVTGDEQGNAEALKCYFQQLEAEPLDLIGPAHQRILMHCLSEVAPDTGGGLDRIRIEEHILQWLQFECEFRKVVWLGRERECPEHLLKNLLQGGSAAVKRCVLTALSQRKGISTEILKTLIALLKDDDLPVRSAAANALYRQSPLSQDILEALVLLLKDNDSEVRSFAAAALKPPLPQEILEALVPLLKDNDSEVRSFAAAALKPPLPQEILEALVPLLKDNDSKVRSTAANALYRQSPLSQDILEALVLLLKDNDSRVRSAAVYALSSQSPLSQEILEALVLLLKDNDSEVRSFAAAALKPPLPQEILEALTQLSEDNDSKVRSAAVYALYKQSPLSQEILEALALLLKDNDSEVRRTATDALNQNLTLPQEILEALTLLLKDDDSEVRFAAARALYKQSPLSRFSQEVLKSLALTLEDKRYKEYNRFNIMALAVLALCQQSPLSQEVLEALVLFLSSQPEYLTAGAEKVFRDHEQFYSIFLIQKAQHWKSLYRIWLKRSFDEQLTCYLRDNILYIDAPEGLMKVPFEKDNQKAFMSEIQAEKFALGVPSRGSSQGTRGGNLQLWMKTFLLGRGWGTQRTDSVKSPKNEKSFKSTRRLSSSGKDCSK